MNILTGTNPLFEIQRLVVPAIILLFAVWLSILIYKTYSLIKIRGAIKRCIDVSMLEEMVIKAHRAPASNLKEESEQQFMLFCRNNKIEPQNPVAKHIHAIYKTGLENGKMDISQLNKYTENSLFNVNLLLKGLSSIFIIMGLFGTLFGLSESFSKIQPALSGLKQNQTTSDIANAIDALFSKLGSAFAPSIAGVFLTIVSVILFTLYLRYICAPVKNEIAYSSINSWIPKLSPTAAQTLVKTLEISEQQMQNNFRAAQKVAEFAENVQTQFNDFSQRISSVNQLLGGMSGVMENLSSASDKFSGNVISMASQHEEMMQCFNRVEDSLEKFGSYVGESVNNINTLQNKIDRSYDDYNEKMSRVVESFDHLKQLSEVNLHLVSAAENSFIEIGKTNAVVVEALKDPIIRSMDEHFSVMTRTFSKELEHIADMFDRMDVPLREAAGGINEVFGNLSKSYDNLSNLIGENIVEKNNRLLNEFLKENRQLVKHVSDLSENSAVVSNLLQQRDLIDKLVENRISAKPKNKGLVKSFLGRFKK